MALGLASRRGGGIEPAARSHAGAPTQDRDRRFAGSRPGQPGSVRRGCLGVRRRAGQGEGAHRGVGAFGWPSTTRPRFFSQSLAACRRAPGASPGALRDQLYELIRNLSAEEKPQGDLETQYVNHMTTIYQPYTINKTTSYEIQRLCQLGQVSRAGYYRHLAPSETKRDDADMRAAIHRVALSDRFYGYRRVTQQLRREGHVVNYKRVRRLMRLDNLLSLRYKP